MKGYKFSGVLAVLFLLVMQTGCAAMFHSSYSSEPIEATVVDADTGEPLEGVIVAAHWQLMSGSFAGRVPVGSAKVMETVTDRAGVFRFPAWGPEVNATHGLLEEKSPQLLIFKNGYRYEGLTNKWERDYSTMSSKRRSEWHGKTIRLKKFTGTLREYADHLGFLKTSLGFAYRGDSCEWKQVPQIIAAQLMQKRRFRELGVPNGLMGAEEIAGQEKCGSITEYLKVYLK